MSGRLRRIAVSSVAIAAVLAGCRGLIEPATVERLGSMRTVEGTLKSLDGIDGLDGVFAVSVTDDEGLRAVVDLGTVTGEPRFTLELPIGTPARGDVAFNWRDPEGLLEYTFFDVPLDGRPLELDYRARRWAGRVEWPESLPVPDDALVFVRLSENVLRGDLGATTLENFFAVDPADGFDVLVSDAAWSVVLWTEDIDGIDRLELRWNDIPWGADVRLDVPLTPVELELVTPPGLDPDIDLDVSFRSPEPSQPFTRVRYSMPAESVIRSTWLPAELDAPDQLSITAPTSIMVLEPRLETVPNVLTPGQRVTVDLGEALLRLRFVDGDGAPVEGEAVIAPWADVLHGDQTGDDGVLDILVPEVVPVLVEFDVGPPSDRRRLQREIDLQTTYTEVVFDVDALYGEESR